MLSSLKTRLLLVLVTSAIPVLALIGYQLVNEYRAAVAAAGRELGEVAAADAGSQQAVLSSMREVLLGLLVRSSVNKADWPRCSTELARFARQSNGLLNVGIVTPDGTLVCSAVPFKAGTINLKDRGWFRSALADGALSIGDYQIGHATGAPSINLALAGRTPGGNRLVAFAALDLKWLRRPLLSDARVAKDGAVALLDREGTILAHSPGSQHGPALNMAGLPLSGTMRAGETRYVKTERNGVHILAAVEPVVVGARPALFLAVAMPMTSVIARPLADLYLDLVVFLVIAGFVLLLAWYIAERSVVRPIAEISAAAARLAEGGAGVRVGNLGGAGEIARLGQSFDTMAAALEARNASLAEAMGQLEKANHTLDAVIRASPAAIICLDLEANVTLWNPAAERLFGWTAAEIVGKPHPVVPQSERDHFATYFKRTLAGESVSAVRGRRMKKDGGPVDVSINSAPLQDDDGQRIGVLYVVNDLTNELQTERQLRQAQKMEAVGQLTGGIAHDFNNLLGVAIGNLDLLEEQAEKNPAALELVRAALGACLRGAELTRQLLAFSRRQPLHPERIAPGEALQAMTELLRRSLGEQVAIRLREEDGVWPVIADATQLETAILNLAVNARDAMPKGGELSIEIANAHLDADYALREIDVVPGDYVEIAVSDTGGGMPPEVAARAFDPFFTTKEAGRGTGLGLSMVYGFIKQSGGHIKIYSEPGHGTTVKLWVPRAADAAEQDRESAPPAKEAAPRGNETILVVEDNGEIRKVVVDQLRSLGYRTIDAGNARDALEILEARDDIDLLFTDVIMPGGKDGRALARDAAALRPGLKVLFTSGFTQAGGGRQEEQLTAPLLSKPYRKQQLAETLRKVLID